MSDTGLRCESMGGCSRRIGDPKIKGTTSVRCERQALAVGRPMWKEVITLMRRQLPRGPTSGGHDPDIAVSASKRVEGNLLSLGGPSGRKVLRRIRGQLQQLPVCDAQHPEIRIPKSIRIEKDARAVRSDLGALDHVFRCRKDSFRCRS